EARVARLEPAVGVDAGHLAALHLGTHDAAGPAVAGVGRDVGLAAILLFGIAVIPAIIAGAHVAPARAAGDGVGERADHPAPGAIVGVGAEVHLAAVVRVGVAVGPPLGAGAQCAVAGGAAGGGVIDHAARAAAAAVARVGGGVGAAAVAAL